MKFDSWDKKSQESFQYSEELMRIFAVREIMDDQGNVKKFEDLDLSDMGEIIDEINSEELDNSEYQELAYS